jgi:hypothetical protein
MVLEVMCMHVCAFAPCLGEDSGTAEFVQVVSTKYNPAKCEADMSDSFELFHPRWCKARATISFVHFDGSETLMAPIPGTSVPDMEYLAALINRRCDVQGPAWNETRISPLVDLQGPPKNAGSGALPAPLLKWTS